MARVVGVIHRGKGAIMKREFKLNFSGMLGIFVAGVVAGILGYFWQGRDSSGVVELSESRILADFTDDADFWGTLLTRQIAIAYAQGIADKSSMFRNLQY